MIPEMHRLVLYTSLAVDRDDSPKHILRIAIEIEAEVYKSEYLKVVTVIEIG